VGLGLQFLRHIRTDTRSFLVVDMSPTSERDPYNDYLIIRNELKEYKFHPSNRPEIICANKMDMPGSEERLQAFIAQLPEGTPVYPISAMNRTNINRCR
ncbi:MAG: GTPase ObgE, partial [Bacillus subtilis]|nr:GTPase ObgE [Bacillus subtilis]